MLRDALVPLSDALLQQTMDLALLQGEGADLDVARALLTLWEQNASAYANADRVADQALFARMTSVPLGEALWDMEDYRPLVLSVAPEQSPALPASMPVMMIYAGTRQPGACSSSSTATTFGLRSLVAPLAASTPAPIRPPISMLPARPSAPPRPTSLRTWASAC